MTEEVERRVRAVSVFSRATHTSLSPICSSHSLFSSWQLITYSVTGSGLGLKGLKECFQAVPKPQHPIGLSEPYGFPVSSPVQSWACLDELVCQRGAEGRGSVAAPCLQLCSLCLNSAKPKDSLTLLSSPPTQKVDSSTPGVLGLCMSITFPSPC